MQSLKAIYWHENPTGNFGNGNKFLKIRGNHVWRQDSGEEKLAGRFQSLRQQVYINRNHNKSSLWKNPSQYHSQAGKRNGHSHNLWFRYRHTYKYGVSVPLQRWQQEYNPLRSRVWKYQSILWIQKGLKTHGYRFWTEKHRADHQWKKRMPLRIETIVQQWWIQ